MYMHLSTMCFCVYPALRHADVFAEKTRYDCRHLTSQETNTAAGCSSPSSDRARPVVPALSLHCVLFCVLSRACNVCMADFQPQKL